MGLTTKLATYYKLGLGNVARVAFYTLSLKVGILRRKMPIQSPVKGPFLMAQNGPAGSDTSNLSQHLGIFEGELKHTDLLFGSIDLPLNIPPDWHRSVLTGKSADNVKQHWSLLSDFGSNAGDIKGIWEPSRFSWLIPMVQNYLASDDKSYIDIANHWIENWSEHNPANMGPNWKCAQETAFRVIHLVTAAMMLDNKKPNVSATRFIEEHLQRILPTLSYAKAQDNNHGTSEAVALYVGSSWLLQSSPNNQHWKKVLQKAQSYLEERIARLILPDGSFSQYSVTYHRLLLDTLNLAELWRRFLGLPALSSSYINRVSQAANWLFELTLGESGDAPNLGANDGAHILNYFYADYRDFRYTTELASLLFSEKSAWKGELYTTVSKRFNVLVKCYESDQCEKHVSEQENSCTAMDNAQRPAVTLFEHGGYALLRSQKRKSISALLRLPTFLFRPSQADVLHVDVWMSGRNVLRDGGSYSYNTDERWLTYFSGSESHNVVEFDGLPQMPKISRFLFGDWPHFSHFKTAQPSSHESQIACGYRHFSGGFHMRTLTLRENTLQITDNIKNVNKQALLRWRLSPNEWRLNDHDATDGNVKISINVDHENHQIALAEGHESRYYGMKAQIPVLEVTVTQDSQITTIIGLS